MFPTNLSSSQPGITARSGLLSSLKSEPQFDIAIIGGGIHGMAVANLASRVGLKVALVEMNDFAAATSSRSSKMAHGGLRYLEMFDFEQVFEGIKAREELFTQAPHIVKPERFLIPIPKGDWFFKLKLKIGLVLYDLMVKDRAHKHRWIPASELQGTGFSAGSKDLEGCFEYTDGLMNDSRLVIEHLLGACDNGAICVNYVKVEETRTVADGVELRCVDELQQSSQEPNSKLVVRAKLVVNCAGPWAPALQGESKDATPLAVKLSRGIHVLFNKPWKGPSLFLPMPGKARYYFVWPHPGGTMIGTTERDTSVAEVDPLPTKDELDEVFARVEKDLPGSGLSRASAHYAFAGIRTLPLRDSSKNSATLSRKHIWRLGERILSLVGGKYTTAVWTAWEGVQEAAKFLGRTIPREAPRAIYPNAISAQEATRLVAELEGSGMKPSDAQRIVSRYGAKASEFLVNAEWREPISDQLLSGELKLAIEFEQAATVEDVLRRRLDLEYRAGNGLAELSKVADALGPNTSSDFERYQTRIEKISESIHA
jgi:glycerol-3-phosphate dehydrogenase